MILLEFRIDESTLAEDLKCNPESEDAAALQLTYFVMPVRFQVGNVDLLRIPTEMEAGNEWYPIPLLYVSGVCIPLIERLRETKTETIHIPGGLNLNLEWKEMQVTITSALSGVVAIADYDELRLSFVEFRRRTRKFLLARAPLLVFHPDWGPWLYKDD